MLLILWGLRMLLLRWLMMWLLMMALDLGRRLSSLLLPWLLGLTLLLLLRRGQGPALLIFSKNS